MRIAMIGTGYVGLVSGACFSDFGHDVVCVDKDEARSRRSKRGVMPIFEPGLDQLVERNVRGGRLSFTTDLAEGVAGADAIFIAVGTPSRRGDGHADLSYVFGAPRRSPALTGRRWSSPSRPCRSAPATRSSGSSARPRRPDAGLGGLQPRIPARRRGDRGLQAPGPDRRRHRRPRAAEIMREVYRPLYLNKAPLLFTSRRTAELIKYAANAFLATKITFINEIADLCEIVGADVQDVARGIGLDNRIGSKFLHAGPRLWRLLLPQGHAGAAEDGRGPRRAAAHRRIGRQGERGRKRAMGRKVIQALGGEARGKTVALLGLTFKPNTDDMRDAPSLSIVQALEDAGAKVRGYDPEGIEQARPMMPNVEFFDDPYAAAEGADAVVLVTEWDVLRALDLEALAATMAQPDPRRPAQRLSARGSGGGRPALARHRQAARDRPPERRNRCASGSFTCR
jgi:UDPglucose 6-dehydrogenase